MPILIAVGLQIRQSKIANPPKRFRTTNTYSLSGGDKRCVVLLGNFFRTFQPCALRKWDLKFAETLRCLSAASLEVFGF